MQGRGRQQQLQRQLGTWQRVGQEQGLQEKDSLLCPAFGREGIGPFIRFIVSVGLTTEEKTGALVMGEIGRKGALQVFQGSCWAESMR